MAIQAVKLVPLHIVKVADAQNPTEDYPVVTSGDARYLLLEIVDHYFFQSNEVIAV